MTLGGNATAGMLRQAPHVCINTGKSKKQKSVMRHRLYKQLSHHVTITFYGICALLGSNPTAYSYSWLGKVSFLQKLPVSSSMLVWSCLQGQWVSDSHCWQWMQALLRGVQGSSKLNITCDYCLWIVKKRVGGRRDVCTIVEFCRDNMAIN